MNMKTLVVMVLMGMSLSAFAEGPSACTQLEQHRTTLPSPQANESTLNAYTRREGILNSACEREKAAAGSVAPAGGVGFSNLPSQAGVSMATRCNALIKLFNDTPPTPPVTTKVKSNDVKQCENFIALAGSNDGLAEVNSRENTVRSLDGTISCKMVASYTVDYESCEKAVAAYNFVVNAEVAMDLQQKIRTDLKAKSIQEDAAREAASGNLQEGALNAGIANHNHMKQMNTEKMAAYSMAVAALVRAYTIIPGEKYAKERCAASPKDAAPQCATTIKNNKGAILANQDAKAGLGLAIAKFTAKGIAAGIAMGQNLHSAKKIEEAKNQYDDLGEDVMMERCTSNPTDPACAKPGNRVAGQSFAGGEFGLGGGGNNAFDMGVGGDNLVEEGAATDLAGNDTVAGINSPFATEAKNAQKIVDLAAAAQMQASGGAAGGGSGGGAGGGGGGGASLGNDLSGTDKDGDKEASIKTNKVSGVYGASGGGGFKGVGKSKDDANPFASLFDAKSNGGIEEDRSIASGDIDGAASGLFQKISKRYSQIQADKRIETKNLE